MSFQQVFPTAILGTNKAAELQIQCPQLFENETVEAKILILSALEMLKEKGAFEPETCANPSLASCPSETSAYCSAQLASCVERLFQIYQKEDEPLIRELSVLFGSRQLVLPPDLVLPAIQFAQKFPQLFSHVLTLTGERGKWLSALLKLSPQNRPQVVESDWETAGLEVRVRILEQVYEAAPQQAAEMLQRTWQAETLSQKKLFLNVLHHNPKPEAAPFLEGVLQSKKEKDAALRRKIAEILVRLPSSAYHKQLYDFFTEHFHFSSKMLSGGKITVEKPERALSALDALGFDKIKDDTEGSIFQVFSLIPPAWIEQKHTNAWENWFKALAKHAKAESYRQWVMESAALHKHEGLIVFLIQSLVRDKNFTKERAKNLISQLSDTRHEQLVSELTKTFSGKPVFYLLTNRTHSWGEKSSLAGLKAVQQQFDTCAFKKSWECPEITEITQAAALYAHPSTLKGFKAICYQFSSSTHDWLKTLEKPLQKLEYRLEMWELLGNEKR